MRASLSITILLAACCGSPSTSATKTPSTAVTTAPAPDAAPAIAPPPASASATSFHFFAVVQLTSTWEECSNAGGAHAAFAVIEPAARAMVVHAGGHAVYGLPTGRRGLALPGAAPASGWFVAEIVAWSRADEDHDGNPDSSVSGWCLDGMPRFGGEVLRLWSAADRADAHRLLPVIGARVQDLVAATGPETISIARVRTAHEDNRAQTMHYALEPIDGAPPAEVVTPSYGDLRPFAGDPLVIAMSDGRVTHVLAARDVADARARAELLRAGRWPAAPAAPVYTGWGADSFEPERLFGEVVGGTAGCGDDILVAPPKDRASILRRAAAPPGARPGDRVTLVVEAQPLDACHRDVHVLRAFSTPGAQDDDWLVTGPPPGPPLAE